MTNERTANILIVDDHEVVISGMKHIIESKCPHSVSVYTSTSGSDALMLAEKVDFDIAFLDLCLQDMSGFDLIDGIRERQAEVRIAVNTMHEEVWVVNRLFEKGVDGILFKSSGLAQVEEAVSALFSGSSYYCEKAHMLRSLETECDCMGRFLTKRELDVLKLISEGKVTNEIASELCVSVNTIETHRRHIMEKMNARNAPELVMKAVSKGLIPVGK